MDLSLCANARASVVGKLLCITRIFTDRIRSMAGGTVFTGVCHSFCSTGVGGVWWDLPFFRGESPIFHRGGLPFFTGGGGGGFSFLIKWEIPSSIHLSQTRECISIGCVPPTYRPCVVTATSCQLQGERGGYPSPVQSGLWAPPVHSHPTPCTCGY